MILAQTVDCGRKTSFNSTVVTYDLSESFVVLQETVCGGAELTEVHEWSSSCGVYHLTLGLTLRGN